MVKDEPKASDDNPLMPRSLKVRKLTWEKWQRMAAAHEGDGVSLTAYVHWLFQQEAKRIKRKAERGE